MPVLLAAAPAAAQQSSQVEVQVERGTSAPGEHPSLAIIVLNRGTADLCAPIGVWEDNSLDLYFHIRVDGRALMFENQGWRPVSPGMVRIEPGKGFRANYLLDSRFVEFRHPEKLGGRWEVDVGFFYRWCDSEAGTEFKSGWMTVAPAPR